MAKKKVTVATASLQSCFGCHISFLDLHEEVLGVFDLIEILHSPIMDVKEVPQVTVGLIEGAVANENNLRVIEEFRKKAKIILAMGSCANLGGVPGMRNFFYQEDVLKRAYVETESTVKGKIPTSNQIPKLLDEVKPVHKVIKVDYYIPGCPPLPEMIKDAIIALVQGKEPEWPTYNLCKECKRYHTLMYIPQREFLTETVFSPMELEQIDTEKCFLEQGVLCMGPATRAGCHTRCINGNIPCRGCFGPTPDALEQGSKMINALSSILPAGTLMHLEDVVGVGYRYSLPVSIYPKVSPPKGGKK